MLINVDATTGEVTRIDGQPEDKALKVCARLSDEISSWLSYRKMAQSGDSRYNVLAVQEFQHALVAMSDLLDNIKGRLTTEELEQYNKFKTECLAQ